MRSDKKSLWVKLIQGPCLETKELKRKVRDIIDPKRDLGHVDGKKGMSRYWFLNLMLRIPTRSTLMLRSAHSHGLLLLDMSISVYNMT
jgi:hypothetical protein